MKIATNTPESFTHHVDHRFVHLGDIENVSIIVLMMEKNWGSNSIDKINAITYWIGKYPKETPCFLVGCESTIPDINIERYRHNERDNAIKSLCNEVLKRSSSIGVRGHITHKYLIDMLGFDKNKIDLIHTGDINESKEKMIGFFVKNNCPDFFIESAILFQTNPKVFYERPTNATNIIKISKPYITRTSTRARLNADITIDCAVETIWCETDATNEKYLLSERADAFLCVIIPFAMRAGKDVECEAPITETYLHNINEILIPHLSAYDSRLHHTKINAVGDSTHLSNGGAIATGMSCGVDSFYTVSLYNRSKYASMNLTHLYCGNYLYGNDGPIYKRAECVSEQLKLPLIKTSTNINQSIKLPHLYTHFFKTMFGVIALRKMFRVYYYSTTEDFSHFQLKNNSTRDTAEIELLLLYAFSNHEFQVISGGAKSERLEKTKALAEFPISHKHLNVCLYPEKDKNCGTCGKCRRTLLTLDMLNILNKFQDVFDIEKYKQDRLESFVYLYKQRNSIMLSDVYKHFKKTEPDLIMDAQAMAQK